MSTTSEPAPEKLPVEKKSKKKILIAMAGLCLFAGGFFIWKNVFVKTVEVAAKAEKTDAAENGHSKQKYDHHEKEKADTDPPHKIPESSPTPEPHLTPDIVASPAAVENEKETQKKKLGPPEIGDIYTIPKLDLNLGNPQDGRFLRIAIALEFDGGEAQLDELKHKQARIHDILITSVSSKDRAGLISDSGKSIFKDELTKKINAVLDEPIARLYFTEFVVE